MSHVITNSYQTESAHSTLVSVSPFYLDNRLWKKDPSVGNGEVLLIIFLKIANENCTILGIFSADENSAASDCNCFIFL